jgi:hypothetical protein
MSDCNSSNQIALLAFVLQSSHWICCCEHHSPSTAIMTLRAAACRLAISGR